MSAPCRRRWVREASRRVSGVSCPCSCLWGASAPCGGAGGCGIASYRRSCLVLLLRMGSGSAQTSLVLLVHVRVQARPSFPCTVLFNPHPAYPAPDTHAPTRCWATSCMCRYRPIQPRCAQCSFTQALHVPNTGTHGPTRCWATSCTCECRPIQPGCAPTPCMPLIHMPPSGAGPRAARAGARLQRPAGGGGPAAEHQDQVGEHDCAWETPLRAAPRGAWAYTTPRRRHAG